MLVDVCCTMLYPSHRTFVTAQTVGPSTSRTWPDLPQSVSVAPPGLGINRAGCDIWMICLWLRGFTWVYEIWMEMIITTTNELLWRCLGAFR